MSCPRYSLIYFYSIFILKKNYFQKQIHI